MKASRRKHPFTEKGRVSTQRDNKGTRSWIEKQATILFVNAFYLSDFLHIGWIQDTNMYLTKSCSSVVDMVGLETLSMKKTLRQSMNIFKLASQLTFVPSGSELPDWGL